jgi:hypothetical protein
MDMNRAEVGLGNALKHQGSRILISQRARVHPDRKGEGGQKRAAPNAAAQNFGSEHSRRRDGINGPSFPPLGWGFDFHRRNGASQLSCYNQTEPGVGDRGAERVTAGARAPSRWLKIQIYRGHDRFHLICPTS